MTTSPTNTLEQTRQAKIDDTDWASFTMSQRVRHIELEGFAVIPDLLSHDQIQAIRSELSQLPTTATDYSEHQRSNFDVWTTDSPNTIDLIALPAMLDFLTVLFGDDLVCTSCVYYVSRPGHPGIAIHTDSQPYGSNIFGLQASSPCLVRVLYYLDDLTPQHSPLKVIPRSHLSMHADGNPYNRYLRHDDEVMVTCKAGSAAVINQKVFHANFPNYSDEDRLLLAIAYRPSWAAPIADVEDRDPQQVAKLSPQVRPLFKSLNTRSIDFDVANRPDDLATTAVGISPNRWIK